MSELTLTLLRLGFLALLWLLVMSVVAVLRRDLFGTQVTRRQTPPQPSRVPRRRPPAGPPTGPAPRSPAGSAPTAGAPTGPRTLVVTEGSLRGTTITLGQAPILVGRAPECTLVLEDDYASGRHARFSLQSGTWVLEDLGSTNGTFIGRNKVETPVAVDPGTPVRIGRTVLELRR
jgi:pSer/pThr/pTyr-binding forkhead associated (FHA) protein